MSSNQPKEQHPSLTGIEYIGYQIFFWSLNLLWEMTKIFAVVVFPSMWLYRKEGGLWRRFTAGFWPVVYAAYPLLISGVIASRWPDFAGIVGMSWMGIFGRGLVFLAVVLFLTAGHRLAYFRVPGGGLIKMLSPSPSRADDDLRAKFPADETYDKKDRAGPVANTRSDFHAGVLGGTGLGKTVTMQRYVNQIDLESDDDDDDDFAIICYDEDGEFEPQLRSRGYETMVFDPRDPDTIPNLMSCVEHPDDIDTVANALVSGTKQENNKFVPGAKNVITGGLRLLYERMGSDATNDTIDQFFDREADEIYEELVESGYGRWAGSLKDAEAGQSPHMNVINTAMTKGLRGKLSEEGNLDLREWVHNPGKRALVLSSGRDDIEEAGPAIRVIMDLAVKEAFRSPDANAFLLADEVDSLPGSSVIGKVAARGRSKGCYVVIGVQTVSQLIDNFGEGPAEQILANLGNYFWFNPKTDQDSWDRLKLLLGEERRREFTNNQSKSSKRMMEKDRHTSGSSEQIKERCPLSDAQISGMKRGDCIVFNFSGDWWFADLEKPEWAD